ncbi:hypothetical protein AVEN_46936-1 [Araneus ventricosus]|uniref:Uncharacterized protein n=1 Tax=Araneus ventricosus TaxID=182803 RepID=A0A4Y2FPS1_ARAVE|nr:hypothetical protein AVEN_46936-1 [Araneus ventricosus]
MVHVEKRESSTCTMHGAVLPPGEKPWTGLPEVDESKKGDPRMTSLANEPTASRAGRPPTAIFTQVSTAALRDESEHFARNQQ